MRITISIFLTTFFIYGFALAQEDEAPFPILPEELEAAEPLDDTEASETPNESEDVQPLTDDAEEAVPDKTPSDPSEQEDEQTDQPMLPEGISEEEARWANWSDWDNVGVKNDNANKAPQQQELIAPQTEEDAFVDQSHAMDKSAVPIFNEKLDATRQISAEPEMADPFEQALDQNNEDVQTQDDNQEENVTDNNDFQTTDNDQNVNPPSSNNPQQSVTDLIDDATAESESALPQKTRYMESFSLRQDKPAKINNRISSVIEKIKVVRRQYFDKQLNTQDNSPFEAMMSVCAFGCYTSILYTPQNEKFNTAGALCWNYPMCETSILAVNQNPKAVNSAQFSKNRTGKPLFMTRYPHGRLTTVPMNNSGVVFPYIGYCQQERSGEFLSMLAIARVSVDYEFTPRMPMDIDVLIANEGDSPDSSSPAVRSSGLTFTVADLASDAMLNCRGGDMSALLTSLAYYAPRESWKNAWSEEWSVLKILDHELKRKVNLSDSDSTDRLYGLTYALRRRLAFDDKRLEIQYAIVDEYLERMKDFALSIQNEDGSFNGAFFTRKGKSRNPDDDFAATAHFARWLTILYHSSALDDPRLTKMIEFLVSELEQRLESWNPSEMSQKDVRAVAYALQAIAIYQQRWAAKSN
ncbi:MAG: hypothetical protein IKX40_06385 [Thermoguttaceae bacterium]|nr:hypothetical protein [Thermoguttaceae bacterium]